MPDCDDNLRVSNAEQRDLAYLTGLEPADQAMLHCLNAPGIRYLTDCLRDRGAVAFLGAGASAPLYPVWRDLLVELVDIAAQYLRPGAAATIRHLAASHPDGVVDLVRRDVPPAIYRAILRELFQPRRDPLTQRSWTAAHEVIARCTFNGIVTTNFDHGIVTARAFVRSRALTTGFATYADEDALDLWRTGDVFQRNPDELPILFAHGQYSQPESIVLATSDYRRAYAGKLRAALRSLIDTQHLVWVGFSFADRHIEAILNEVAEGSGPRLNPGQPPRHIAIMPWAPHSDLGGERLEPRVLRDFVENEYGSRLIFYPAPENDHSALARLLTGFVADRFPPVSLPVAAARSSGPGRPRENVGVVSDGKSTEEPLIPRRPLRTLEAVPSFVGRAEELARLDRWATDPEVRLIGVTAWGGAGKTALVAQWLRSGMEGTRDIQAAHVFAWSFYEDRSFDSWATALLSSVGERFDPRQLDDRVHEPSATRASEAGRRSTALATAVTQAVRRHRLILVLDGLEVLQEGPREFEFGRLLDGALRITLVGLCETEHDSLVILTSRFPFADLELFDGGAVRIIDVPRLSAEEGSEVLSRTGGAWVPGVERRQLVDSVDGHALAVTALARLAAGRVTLREFRDLRQTLELLVRTDARVQSVLSFYADHLSAQDRFLVGLVSQFRRPVSTTVILTLGKQPQYGEQLKSWLPADVATAVTRRLTGLLTMHDDGGVSAHPLVRDVFRQDVLRGEQAKAASELILSDVPGGAVHSTQAAITVSEVTQLLTEAGEWELADAMYRDRLDDGDVFYGLPAPRVGMQTAVSFVSPENRVAACDAQLGRGRLLWYLNDASAFAYQCGDLDTALHFANLTRSHGTPSELALSLRRLAQILTDRGATSEALALANQAVDVSQEWSEAKMSSGVLGWIQHRLGQSVAADAQFRAAGVVTAWIGTYNPDDTYGDGGYRLAGLYGDRLLLIQRWWCEHLRLTERKKIARRLAEAVLNAADKSHDRLAMVGATILLGKLDLDEGYVDSAGKRLTQGAKGYLDSDNLLRWAAALPSVSEHSRRSGNPGEAERIASRLLAFTAPRGLVPLRIAALSARSRARADRAAEKSHRWLLDRARDDAESANRLATSTATAPWEELGALEAAAHVDAVEGVDGGSAARATLLREKLVCRDTLKPETQG
jgi:hypothetical protein